LPKSFGSKLAESFDNFGQLCVGIDPHESLLELWGLEDDIQGLDYFGNRVVETCAGRVGIIKPQISFFERHGSKGFEVLERVTHRAHEAGLLVIADAKRGDIGSTMSAYLEGWLGRGSSFYADTMTVSPFLGLRVTIDHLQAYLERGKGVIALVATSNPEGSELQLSLSNGETVSSQLWNEIHVANQVAAAAGDRFGPVGAVVGATLNFRRYGLDLDQSGIRTPILAPGFGAQGVELSDAGIIFGAAAQQTIASVSRSVLQNGASALASSIDRANDELRSGLDR
jgi:orotidine-5'-phosphate decarboxylase